MKPLVSRVWFLRMKLFSGYRGRIFWNGWECPRDVGQLQGGVRRAWESDGRVFNQWESKTWLCMSARSKIKLQLVAQVKEVTIFLRKIISLNNPLKKAAVTWAVKDFNSRYLGLLTHPWFSHYFHPHQFPSRFHSERCQNPWSFQQRHQRHFDQTTEGISSALIPLHPMAVVKLTANLCRMKWDTYGWTSMKNTSP